MGLVYSHTLNKNLSFVDTSLVKNTRLHGWASVRVIYIINTLMQCFQKTDADVSDVFTIMITAAVDAGSVIDISFIILHKNFF